MLCLVYLLTHGAFRSLNRNRQADLEQQPLACARQVAYSQLIAKIGFCNYKNAFNARTRI